LPVDAFVATSDATGLVLDLALDLRKVIPPSTRDVIELSPFVLTCDASRRVWYMYLVILRLVVSAAGYVDELKYQGPPCDDSTASREEITADNVFENR